MRGVSPDPQGPGPAWQDEDWLTELFRRHSAAVLATPDGA